MVPQVRLVAGVAVLMTITPWGFAAQTFALDSVKGLQPHKVTLETAIYHGRKAIRVMPSPEADAAREANPKGSGGAIVVLPETIFHNGRIEIELAGKPRTGAPDVARGFVGVAFRVAGDASKYEAFYIRPTNGRANDQLRRNHSTQYFSFPDYEWDRLRKESPGQYESYADMDPGEWTRIKIEVNGVKALLYVNGAPQPVLVVNDLKLGDGKGAVALWVGPGTEAYFTNLRLSE